MGSDLRIFNNCLCPPVYSQIRMSCCNAWEGLIAINNQERYFDERLFSMRIGIGIKPMPFIPLSPLSTPLARQSNSRIKAYFDFIVAT